MKDRPEIVTHETQLSRDLGLFDITMIGVGAMIGAGIFVLTGIAAGTTGPSLMLSFALNGVLTIFTAMVYAELGSAIPEAGGGYLWVKEALGRSNGFVAGWMSWFSHAVAGSLYALGFGAYAGLLLSDLGVTIFGLPEYMLEKVLAVTIAVIFIYVNYRGASETGLAGNVVTVAKLITIGLFVAFGLVAMVKSPDVLAKFSPFFPNGFGNVFIAMGITFIAFEGYEIIVQAGEEVKDPKRNIPRAIFYSLMIVVPIYVLVAAVSIGAISGEGMASWQFLGLHKELGLVEAARRFMPLGTLILLVGGLMSTVSALNATTYSSTRVSFAMGRDNVLPSAFARIHPQTRTPYIALLATGALIILMIVAIPIEDVAAAADVMFLLLFLQVNYAVMKIRDEFGDRLDYGYLMPFYPVVPIVGIVTKLLLAIWLYKFSPTAWYSAALWVGVGLLFYLLYAKEQLETGEKPEIAFEVKTGSRSQKRILTPIADPSHTEAEMKVAAALARSGDAEVVALNVVTVPTQTPLSEGYRHVQDAQPVLQQAQAIGERFDIPVSMIVGIGHRVSSVIDNIGNHEGTDMIVMGWHGDVQESKVRGSVAKAVLGTTQRDTVIVKDHGIPDEIREVAVALSPGIRSEVTLRTAARLAQGFKAKLRLFTVLPAKNASKYHETEGWLDSLLGSLEAMGIAARNASTTIVHQTAEESIAEIVAREGNKSNLLVIGASRDWVLKQHLLGSMPDKVANNVRVSTLMVKEAEPAPLTLWRRLVSVIPWNWMQ